MIFKIEFQTQSGKLSSTYATKMLSNWAHQKPKSVAKEQSFKEYIKNTITSGKLSKNMPVLFTGQNSSMKINKGQ